MPKFSLVLNKFAEILNSQTFKFAEILSIFFLIRTFFFRIVF